MTLETEAPKAPESIAPEAPTAEFNETLIVEEELEVVSEEIAEPIEMEVDDYATIADVMVEAASFELEELQPTLHEYNEEVSAVFVSVPEADEATDFVLDEVAEPVMEVELEESSDEEVYELNMETTSVDFTTEFVLQKPSNIYEETPEVAEPATSFTFEFDEVETEQIEEPIEEETIVEETIIEEPIMETSFRMVEHTEEEPSMQLVMKEVELTNTARPAHQDFDMPVDNAEEQRRKVAERIQKLRNLSFNINNGADPNTEFDAVPAYVRRNLDLFGNTMASVENYYSKYTVEQDENNQTNISTINSFLDGKKPD
jgi:cell division protein FtsZ